MRAVLQEQAWPRGTHGLFCLFRKAFFLQKKKKTQTKPHNSVTQLHSLPVRYRRNGLTFQFSRHSGRWQSQTVLLGFGSLVPLTLLPAVFFSLSSLYKSSRVGGSRLRTSKTITVSTIVLSPFGFKCSSEPFGYYPKTLASPGTASLPRSPSFL